MTDQVDFHDIEEGIYEFRTKSIKKSVLKKAFSFQVPPGTPILLHAIIVGHEGVGYVATENYGAVGGPHIWIRPDCRKREILERVTAIFHGAYRDDLKSRGMWALTTNCDQADAGTRNFLKTVGFELKDITVAEFVL